MSSKQIKETRLEIITACVDDQIKRGIIKAERRQRHISLRMNGGGCFKKMTLADCRRWYDEVFSA